MADCCSLPPVVPCLFEAVFEYLSPDILKVCFTPLIPGFTGFARSSRSPARSPRSFCRFDGFHCSAIALLVAFRSARAQFPAAGAIIENATRFSVHFEVVVCSVAALLFVARRFCSSADASTSCLFHVTKILFSFSAKRQRLPPRRYHYAPSDIDIAIYQRRLTAHRFPDFHATH